MSKKKLEVDWGIESKVEDFKPTLMRYRKYLIDSGFRSSTIESCVDMSVGFLSLLKAKDHPVNVAD